MNNYDKPVQYIKGVGPVRAAILKRVGVESVFGLLNHFPFRYEDRRKMRSIRGLDDGEEANINAVVTKHRIIPLRRRRAALLVIILEDGTGKVEMACFNQAYLAEALPVGTQVIIHGKFKRKGRVIQVSSFEYEKLSGTDEDLISTKRIVPVYPATEGLNQRFLRTVVRRVLDEHGKSFKETLSDGIVEKYSLESYSSAINNAHFPRELEDIDSARRRLIFEEFFYWELGMALKKQGIKKLRKARKYEIKKTLLSRFRENLGFEFTKAQKRVINEIFEDMLSPGPMNRLLQGDVGSGKTVVAIASILLAVENGYQAALMAPTEILAEQHMNTLEKMMKNLGLTVELITSRQKAKAGREALERIEKGKSNIVIGTHALIEEKVRFKSLGLIVIDEQHKFGVLQRSRLRKKGSGLDVLVMTATPIPRTLAMTVYGDLDVSVIDELPPGRKPVVTEHMGESACYKFVMKKVEEETQVYIVYPLVNESDKLELKSVVEMSEKLKNTVFKKANVGILHGQMKSDEKEAVMKRFIKKEIDILITTIIIEVGIDVPNASVMVIEHSERFGLATLHQLRGRVGRGTGQSYCIMLGRAYSPDAKQRRNVMLATNDGFRIAEEDLRLRGSGEFFGTEQHGMPEFRMGNIITDQMILNTARKAAFELVSMDPDIALPENSVIKRKFTEQYSARFALGDVG